MFNIIVVPGCLQQDSSPLSQKLMNTHALELKKQRQLMFNFIENFFVNIDPPLLFVKMSGAHPKNSLYWKLQKVATQRLSKPPPHFI